MIKICLEAGPVNMEAELNDSASARAIAKALPFTGSAQVWGDEIYFPIPVALDEEAPQAEVLSGTIAYWPPGKALCIFFGQTPASPINVVGRLLGDPNEFGQVSAGIEVRVSVAET